MKVIKSSQMNNIRGVMNMEEMTVVKEFFIMGRRCIVVKIKRILTSEYHNGYIRVSEEEYKKIVEEHDYDLPEEVTYHGDLRHISRQDGYKYIGFDSAHYYNQENPDTQTEEYVMERCRKIVEKLGALSK